MPKRKCKLCKEYSETFVKHPIGVFCTQEHALQFAAEKSRKAREKAYAQAKKADKKKTAAAKRDFNANDIKTRAAAAKKACHRYIKLRDWGKPCICCGRPFKGTFQAGHWQESGNNSKIRYHEDNIHGQSVYCNMYKGGDSDDYEGRLRLKIGDKRVDYLLANKGGTMKRTAQDYKVIEDYYKDKLKVLER